MHFDFSQFSQFNTLISRHRRRRSRRRSRRRHRPLFTGEYRFTDPVTFLRERDTTGKENDYNNNNNNTRDSVKRVEREE